MAIVVLTGQFESARIPTQSKFMGGVRSNWYFIHLDNPSLRV